ncbi:UNVERIFIED_CONTAM: CobQ/CobB/MinD/ParA family nucleotide binding protein [Acetivibrio alkalicellulosi]
MSRKRISIFTGHFGSGKTEISINFALNLSRSGFKTAIVDFDIINPYFRATDAKKILSDNSVYLISPIYANTNVDVPALSPETNALIEKKEYNAVFDVGGDDLGAKALARYNEELLREGYEMYFVINTKRPMTDSIPKIRGMIREIENVSGLKVTRLVNNTNLLVNTTIDDVMNGHMLIKEVSDKEKIPIEFVSGFCKYISGIEKLVECEVLCLEKNIKLPWD